MQTFYKYSCTNSHFYKLQHQVFHGFVQLECSSLASGFSKKSTPTNDIQTYLFVVYLTEQQGQLSQSSDYAKGSATYR